MYNKVSTDLKFVDREKQVLEYWNENDIFRKSIKIRENGEPYTFYDGTSARADQTRRQNTSVFYPK